MSELLASVPVRNSRVLCIGGVTAREAQEAQVTGVSVEPSKFYLFLASACDPSAPIEILAQFFSADHAERAAENLPGIA